MIRWLDEEPVALGEVKPGGYWKQDDATRFGMIAVVATLAIAYLVYEMSR
jgi:hypothetical protein